MTSTANMLTLAQAAERLGVQPGTLRRQIHLEKLAAQKRGRDWFVTPAEVERYRTENQPANPHAPKRD